MFIVADLVSLSSAKKITRNFFPKLNMSDHSLTQIQKLTSMPWLISAILPLDFDYAFPGIVSSFPFLFRLALE